MQMVKAFISTLRIACFILLVVWVLAAGTKPMGYSLDQVSDSVGQMVVELF